MLFAKTPSVHEILNDLDGHVIHFYRMLRERPEELELACRLTPYSRTEYLAADPNDPSIDDLERARRWWTRLNQSFAKNGSGATGWSTSIRRGSNNARSVWNRIDRFAGVVERLAKVTLENRDALEVIAEYSDPRGVIYCDPPYLAAVRTAYADGRRPHGEYVHEFATEDEHRQLAEALHASSSLVLLSGYHSDLYDGLYEHWTRLERQVVRGTAATRGSSKPFATEVLWCNQTVAPDRLFELASVAT